MRCDDSESDDWNYDVPKKEEVRFIPADDLLSSDDTNSQDGCARVPKKYEQLNPRAKSIFKLLKSVKTQPFIVWKTLRDPKNSGLIVTPEQVLGLCVASQDTMAKNSSKRKFREEDQESNHFKKRRKNCEDSFKLTTSHREQAHSISCSESEDESFERNSNIACEGGTIEKNPLLTSYVDSNTSDPENDINHKTLSPNKVLNRVDNCDQSSVNLENDQREETFDSESVDSLSSNLGKSNLNSANHLDDKTIRSGNINTKQLLVPKFTAEDQQEIARFSEILNENVLRENNIWIMQCPKDLNCDGLINEYLNFNDNFQLDDGKNRFEVCSFKCVQSQSTILAVPSELNHMKLCKIPISGNIKVEKEIAPMQKATCNIPGPSHQVVFPDNLRKRHCLLGIDYEKQPRTKDINVKNPKKKKKKHSISSEMKKNKLINDEDLLSSGYISEDRKKKKKSHDKSLESNSISEDLLSPEDISEHQKKKKKRKSLKNSFDSNSIGEDLLSSKDVSEHLKKKKERKSLNNSLDSNNEEQLEGEPFEVTSAKRKKKKKHKNMESD